MQELISWLEQQIKDYPEDDAMRYFYNEVIAKAKEIEIEKAKPN